MNAQQLKNSILQMAIQGKLVPQDPDDEPASVLIERIREEKEKLIKEKKIKKEKNPSFIFRGTDNITYEKIGKNEPISIEDELPFEIPESWEWVRFKNLVNYSLGKTPPRKEVEYWSKGTIPWVSIADLVADGTVIKTKECINEYAAKKTFKGGISKVGTLLMSFKLTVGKVSILEIDAFHNEAIISIYPYIDNNRITTQYLFKVLPLLSQEGDTKFAIKGKTLNSTSLGELLIPLPPLMEQKRIFDKLRELEPFLKKYDAADQEATRLNDNFPSQLKKSILQEAVQGRLVPQDLSDEPASVLLERIRAEKQKLIKEGKIKKDKNESIIYRRDNSHYEKRASTEICIDTQLPFNIPDSWEWCYLGNIAFITKLAGFEYTKFIAPNLTDSGIPLFKGKNVQNGNLVLNFEGYIPEQLSDKLFRSQVTSKCLLTPYVGTIGNIAIFDGSFKAHLGSNVGKIELINPIEGTCVSEEYVLHYLRSPVGYQQLTKQKKATAQESISIDAIRNVLIPIPPFKEQMRIIHKIFDLNKKVQAL